MDEQMNNKKEAKEPIKMVPTAPQYDPSKQYTWPKDAVFQITGAQFGLWLNHVRGVMQTPEFQEHQLVAEASMAIEQIMETGVKAGVIVPLAERQAAPPPPPPGID